MLLPQISVEPTVFSPTGYVHSDVCDAHLTGLKETLLERVLVHDLYEGQLSQKAIKELPSMSKGRELLKKMHQRRRLLPVPKVSHSQPTDSSAWVTEALDSNKSKPVMGILASPSAKAQFAGEVLVSDVTKRTGSKWWQDDVERHSWTVQRTADQFLAHLAPLLLHAHSLKFVEPYLDPSDKGYAWLGQLVEMLAKRDRPPDELEFHRGHHDGSGDRRRLLDSSAVREIFSPIGSALKSHGISADVVVWHKMHNRYLLTNLGSFSLGNSLREDPNDPDVWTRLDQKTRTDLLRQYDAEVHTSRLVYDPIQIGA